MKTNQSYKASKEYKAYKTFRVLVKKCKVPETFETFETFELFKAFGEACKARKVSEASEDEDDKTLRVLFEACKVSEEYETLRAVLEVLYKTQISKASTPWKAPIITILSHFLCERRHIEWVGDLYETREQWQKQGLTPWSINLRMSGIALQLLWAQLYCTVYDRVFTRYWGKPL